jgi:serine/threonine protein kinase
LDNVGLACVSHSLPRPNPSLKKNDLFYLDSRTSYYGQGFAIAGVSMAVPLETFVKQLTESGVIAPGKLESFVPPKAQPKDAQELARQLVQSKQLTRFQAQEIYAGRAKSLMLGNYTLVDKIGAGGMGQVFKAQHRRMKRVVAIKMLPGNVLKDAVAAARFQREVEAAAKLEHPNIVTAHDADEANGVHFLVMQYVNGQDLSVIVKKNGPFPVDKAVDYILQAAKGLEYAHKKGVVHRDIKPANLLLDNEGTVKILDMGLARIEAGGDAATQAELTGTGAVMGTVDYMAPEQGLSTKHADAKSDIYSLGCSLYYLLTGMPVYEGETLAAKLLAHHNNPIPDLRKIRSDVPAGLAAVFRKMVAKAPEKRYQTVSEVIAALERLPVVLSVGNTAKLPDARTPPAATVTSINGQIGSPTASRTRSWWRDRRVMAGVFGGGACLLLAVWMLLPPSRQRGGDPSADPTSVGSRSDEMSMAAEKSARERAEKAKADSVAKRDLLSKIDVRQDSIEGVWRRDDKGLISPVQSFAQLALPALPEQSYRLLLEATRELGSGPLVIGLPVGSTQCVVTLDSGGIAHANSLGELKEAHTDSRVRSTFGGFERGRAFAVECRIAVDSIAVSIDGAEVLRYTGDVQSFSVPPRWATRDSQTPFLGVALSRFRISRLEFEPAPGSSNSSAAKN